MCDIISYPLFGMAPLRAQPESFFPHLCVFFVFLGKSTHLCFYGPLTMGGESFKFILLT